MKRFNVLALSLTAAMMMTSAPAFASGDHEQAANEASTEAPSEAMQNGMMGGHGQQGMTGGQGQQGMMKMMMQMHSQMMAGNQSGGMGGVMGLADKLAEFDSDGDGALNIAEFEALHSAAIREQMVDRFQALDNDGDGIVTAEEMAVLAARMEQMTGEGMGQNSGSMMMNSTN